MKPGDLVRFKRLVYNLGVGLVIETPHPSVEWGAIKVYFPLEGTKSFHRSLIEIIK